MRGHALDETVQKRAWSFGPPDTVECYVSHDEIEQRQVTVMKQSTRVRLGLALLAIIFLTYDRSAFSDEWPNRSVRIIVPFPAGGATDRMARLIADELSKTFKQQFYIENRVGAGGAVGGLQAAKSDPDGYTLLMGNYSTNMTTPIQNPKVGYHAIDDFTNIAMVGGEATALVLNASVNVKTFPDWISWVRKQSDPVNVGGAGPGTISELIVEQLKRSPSLKLNLNMVGYPTGNMLTNLLGNHVPAGIVTLSAVVPHLQGTTLVPIALAANERNPATQNVPTFAELGHPEIGAILWYYVAGPKNLPRNIVDKLNIEIRKLIKAPPLSKQLEQSSYITMDVDATALTDFLARDFVKWTAMYENAGFKTK
jgi:tripartite-type tricarboxylate transporter receptor subunit TctC